MAETKLKKNLAVQVIKDHNISNIEVDYSGGGDDGCIDSVRFEDHNENNVNIIYYDHNEKDIKIKMAREIESEWDDLIYDLLNKHVEWDWINNEGGCGTMVIDCTYNPWNISIDHQQRIMEDHTYSDIDFEL